MKDMVVLVSYGTSNYAKQLLQVISLSYYMLHEFMFLNLKPHSVCIDAKFEQEMKFIGKRGCGEFVIGKLNF